MCFRRHPRRSYLCPGGTSVQYLDGDFVLPEGGAEVDDEVQPALTILVAEYRYVDLLLRGRAKRCCSLFCRIDLLLLGGRVGTARAPPRWTTTTVSAWTRTASETDCGSPTASRRRYMQVSLSDKKLSCRRRTARCVMSVEILPTTTQQCRNYLYDKS